MIDIFSTEPTHVNENGVKWWLDESLTKYSRNHNGEKDESMKDVVVWCVERPNGYRTRVMTEGNEILEENQTLEGMACKIDWIRISRNFK